MNLCTRLLVGMVLVVPSAAAQTAPNDLRAAVDQLGDFDNALEMAASLGKTRSRPRWVRPQRPFLERFVGRIGGPVVTEGIVSQLERVLTGGLYYMATPYLPGQFPDEQEY